MKKENIKKENIKKMLILQLIIFSIGVLAIILTKTSITKLIPPCTVKKAIGVICPTCGVTRCVSNFLSLNFEASFMYHPVAFILTSYLIFIDIIYIINTVFDKKFFKILYPSINLLIIFFVVFFFQYFYRVYMIVSFNGFSFL